MIENIWKKCDKKTLKKSSGQTFKYVIQKIGLIVQKLEKAFLRNGRKFF